MSKSRKVKRWKSRPASKKQSIATYPRPESREVYKLTREGGAQTRSELNKEYEKYKKETSPAKKSAKKKSKYKSAPARQRPVHTAADAQQIRLERQRRRKRNNALLRAAVVSAVLVIGVTVCIFIFFKIGEIKVIGSDKYTASQIIEASGIELGDNLFAPSASSAQSKICKALPYVKSVTFKHELPDVLTICIKQTEAKYAFKSGNKYIITDSSLKVLEKADELPEGTAEVVGVGIKDAKIGTAAKFSKEEKGELVLEISSALAEQKIENISSINVSSTVDLSAVYAGRITILLGQNSTLEYKCQLAAAAIKDIEKDNKKAKGTINVKQAEETKQAYYNPNS